MIRVLNRSALVSNQLLVISVHLIHSVDEVKPECEIYKYFSKPDSVRNSFIRFWRHTE